MKVLFVAAIVVAAVAAQETGNQLNRKNWLGFCLEKQFEIPF